MTNINRFLAVPALLAISGAASAAITGPTTVTFQNMDTATYGKSNTINGVINSDGSNCVGVGTESCYVENGVVISTIYDETSLGAHLHAVGVNSNSRRLHTHGDAGGVYIRLTDGSAFSFESIQIASSYNEDLDNVYTKFLADGVTLNPDWDSTIDNFIIKGFNSAYNPNLWQNDYNGLVAEASIYIGYSGTLDILALNAAFANVNAVWIYAGGRYNFNLASQRPFDVKYDNVKLNAPVVPPAAPVPVPGAIWLFGSALLAFVGRSTRRNKLTA